MPQDNPELEQVVKYMKAHWASKVEEKWQVALTEYPEILQKIVRDFSLEASKGENPEMARIAGLSGSGKTTQLLPAVEAYFRAKNKTPILIAARRFVQYHPHYNEILARYGAKNVRKMTDEFATIMMFLTLNALTREGYDIILDVTFLDPEIEGILLKFLKAGSYSYFITMIAVAPEVAEKHLAGREWRHSKETEQEFIRVTKMALEFYAEKMPETRIVLWNTFSEDPVYDGDIRNSVEIFARESSVIDIPEHDEGVLREMKIKYLSNFEH